MWDESVIKTRTRKQVQIGTWTADPVRLTMWETVYGAESLQLNMDPCGSSCPSKAREGNNKHVFIISLLAGVAGPEHSAGSVFLCFACAQLCEICVHRHHFLCIIPELCGSAHCCLFTAEMIQPGRSERNEWVMVADGVSGLKKGLIQCMSLYKGQYIECMFDFCLRNSKHIIHLIGQESDLV